jgi:tryptophan 2,3-dioxygenase
METSVHKNQGPTYYGDYLELSKLLDSQHPKSLAAGAECHDETLFIIVHQVYELWFKQILHEMKSMHSVFSQAKIEESQLTVVVARLERIKRIQSLLLDQLGVMETMTPMDFLEFRDLLVPASGFQSVQFREVEVLMGLNTKNRKAVDRDYFLGRLSQEDKQRVLDQEEEASLLDLIQNWLERMPITQEGQFDFWQEYSDSVTKMLDEDYNIIQENLATLDPKMKEAQLANLEATRKTFASLLDKDAHEKLIQKGDRKLSQKATLNALFIMLYRDEPLLHLPYLLITSLIDIDENFTTWRYRHALMAQRLLGTKIGTGGSSGHHYLKLAADNNRVYEDLFNLSTFIIPHNLRPDLPEDVIKKINFL